MNSEDNYIGKQIGNYQISERLNGGAFGRIYKGVHIYLPNRIVAIKVLHLTYLGSPEERENFMQEARFLEMLKHPNILPMYDLGIDDGFPYLVAEFASNGSLRDQLQHRQLPILSIHEVMTILTQVGQALQYVHEQNIVHRDLKPENILFNAKGQALLADFGISVFLETTRTKNVDVIGSPLYMAPEQFDGFISPRSDQYSLACIAYELLTGAPPFVASHPLALGMKHQQEQPRPLSEINANVPLHVEDALLKALSKKREDRFPDIPSFIAALLSVSTGSLQMTKEQWLDEGNRLFNINRYAEALHAFERSLHLDPSFADAYEGKGSALFFLGRSTEALAAYEQAIRLDANYASAFLGKANVLFELKHYNEALTFYQQALVLDSALVDAYVGKANVLYYLKHYDEALSKYEQAIQLDPYSVAAIDGKSWALRQLLRYEEALQASERAVELSPHNPLVVAGKARSLFRLKRYEESLTFFEQAIHLDPRLAQTHDFKGDTLYHMKKFELALASYKRAIQLDPHLASAYEGLGDVCSHFQHYQEALLSYERAIHLKPKIGIFHFKKAEVLRHMGRLEEAQGAYEEARALGYKI